MDISVEVPIPRARFITFISKTTITMNLIIVAALFAVATATPFPKSGDYAEGRDIKEGKACRQSFMQAATAAPVRHALVTFHT